MRRELWAAIEYKFIESNASANWLASEEHCIFSFFVILNEPPAGSSEFLAANRRVSQGLRT